MTAVKSTFVFHWSSISSEQIQQILGMLPSSDRTSLFVVSCLLLVLTLPQHVYAAFSTAALPNQLNGHEWQSMQSKSSSFSSSSPPLQAVPSVPVSYRVQISLGDISSSEKSGVSAENRHSSTPPPPPSLSSMMLQCPGSTELLSVEQVCDGVVHCPQGTDESKLACELHLRRRRGQLEATDQVNILFYIAIAVSVLFYTLFISIVLVHCIGVGQSLKKQTSIELSSIRPSKT